MAEPTVNFNLRMPVDLDEAVRADAARTGTGINSTLVSWLRTAEQVISEQVGDLAIAEKLEGKRE